LGNFCLYAAPVRADPGNKALRYAALRPVKMGLDIGIKLTGGLVALLGYPPAVMIGMLLAMLLFVVPERRAEESLSAT
jgi:hypothetical protein